RSTQLPLCAEASRGGNSGPSTAAPRIDKDRKIVRISLPAAWRLPPRATMAPTSRGGGFRCAHGLRWVHRWGACSVEVAAEKGGGGPPSDGGRSIGIRSAGAKPVTSLHPGC